MPPYAREIQEYAKYIKNRGDIFKISGGLLEHIGGISIRLRNENIRSVARIDKFYAISYHDCLVIYRDGTEFIIIPICDAKTILYFSLDPFWIFYLDENNSVLRTDGTNQSCFYRHDNLEVNWYEPPILENGELSMTFIRKRKVSGIRIITLVCDDKNGFYITHEKDDQPIEKLITTNSITAVMMKNSIYHAYSYYGNILYYDIAPYMNANITHVGTHHDDIILYLDTGEICCYDGTNIFLNATPEVARHIRQMYEG